MLKVKRDKPRMEPADPLRLLELLGHTWYFLTTMMLTSLPSTTGQGLSVGNMA